VRPARDVLLQDVVLDGAGQSLGRHAVTARDGDVEGEQDGGGRVDRHRRRHALERDSLEQVGHVLHRREGDADLADLAERDRRIGVVAHLGRQVEGDTEAGLHLNGQESVAVVDLVSHAVSYGYYL